MIPNSSRPAGVVVSIASVSETNPTSRSPSVVTVCTRCARLRPRRSSRHTTSVSPGRSSASSSASRGREARASEAVSSTTRAASIPAATRASSCSCADCSAVEMRVLSDQHVVTSRTVPLEVPSPGIKAGRSYGNRQARWSGQFHRLCGLSQSVPVGGRLSDSLVRSSFGLRVRPCMGGPHEISDCESKGHCPWIGHRRSAVIERVRASAPRVSRRRCGTVGDRLGPRGRLGS